MEKKHSTRSDKHSIDYEENIKNLNSEIYKLRAELFKERNELQELKNSRVFGRIIRTRELIGDTRHKLIKLSHLPRDVSHNIFHRIRVIGAPFIPTRARKYLKAQYKITKSRLSKTQVRIEVKNNEPQTIGAPLVSIVIPYFNRHDTIDETVESIGQQTYTKFEVIIVDDGSTLPESIEKINSIRRSGFKAEYITQKNQGVAAARNNGISKAKGRYIICLDSDDILTPTFIEKCTLILESRPDIALVTTNMEVFGVVNEVHKNIEYSPVHIYSNNMVITAAEFRKSDWEAVGGYKSGIGYEDWEFWLNLSEHGFWGKLIPESIFRYRTALNSRYIEDKDAHWVSQKLIRNLHPKYKGNIKKQIILRKGIEYHSSVDTVFVNMNKPSYYKKFDSRKANILITIPWMTFGGAETLIYNYCREIKDEFNITFVTGLQSNNEWEYKFKKITPYIYHLSNLFSDKKLYLEFISNYIYTRNINVLHIIHNGFTFEMLEELRRRHARLRVVVTMFNDRVEYFGESAKYEKYIDIFVTDNKKVAHHYKELLPKKDVKVISNGINCYDEFNPELYDRDKERASLNLESKDLAVFFVGRLSSEKNPDVFIKAAKNIINTRKIKNVKFFIIGDGPMKVTVEEGLKNMTKNQIEYLGYKSNVANYFSAADIFVLPSSIEGFPLSILEAMAMGVAVIASDVGAVAEVVEKGKQGVIVKPGSVKEITEAIVRLSQNPKLLKSMKNNARKKVEIQYSNIILGKNYRSLYEKVVK